MSHWHTIEFPQDALLIKFLIWRFSELFFHVFFLYYHFKTFSNDFLMNNFISNDSIFLIAHNCNYLILCHRSFICKAHVHDSTTQVSPPFQVSFLFSRFHFSLTLSLHHPFSFHDQFSWATWAVERGSQLPLFVCLSVCLSVCLLICLSVYGRLKCSECTVGEDYKIALLFSRFFCCKSVHFRAIESNLSSWHANSLLSEWAS